MQPSNGQLGSSANFENSSAAATLNLDALATPAQFRMGLISVLAAGVGLLAGGVAFLLYHLIGLFTNLFFFHRLSTDFVSARLNHLGLWVIVIPVLGGVVVGFMAKFGS